MIEVSLYSIPTGADLNAAMGTCVDRTRFDKEALGTSVMEFVKGFLKTNIAHFEGALNNAGIVNFINSDDTMTTTDFASINYWLAKSGYVVKIFNVTDDEENATAVGTAEWNIIDKNFLQNDYPTAVKIIPEDGTDVVSILKQVIEQNSLFDQSKLGETRNPLKDIIEQLEKVKEMMGHVEPGLASKLYEILAQCGIDLFLATAE